MPRRTPLRTQGVGLFLQSAPWVEKAATHGASGGRINGRTPGGHLSRSVRWPSSGGIKYETLRAAMGIAQEGGSDETPATAEEVKKAIESLSEPQLVRLKRYAAFRHRGLGARAAGRSPADLESDAVIALLDGRRNWTKSKVDFLTCLMGIIRSLSSHIRTGESRDAFDDLAPVPERHDDGVEDPLERFPNSRMVDPHRELEARELDEQIRERFKDDAEALLIYECFGQRMAPAEIRNLLELSVQQFDAAAKRLRRGVQRLRGGSRL